jgi:hypothetical protein
MVTSQTSRNEVLALGAEALGGEAMASVLIFQFGPEM